MTYLQLSSYILPEISLGLIYLGTHSGKKKRSFSPTKYELKTRVSDSVLLGKLGNDREER